MNDFQHLQNPSAVLKLRLWINEPICRVHSSLKHLHACLFYTPVSVALNLHVRGGKKAWLWSFQMSAVTHKLLFLKPPGGRGVKFQHRVLLAQSENKSFQCLPRFTAIPNPAFPILRGQIPHSLHLFRGAPSSEVLVKGANSVFKRRPHTRWSVQTCG